MIELTRDDVRHRLSTAIRDAGSQRAFAARVGMSPAHVCDMLHGKRQISERVLAQLDLVRIERFVSRRSS